MESQLFEIMRFQILTAALNPATRKNLGDSLVYAWDHRVYPSHDGERGAAPFASVFGVTKTMIEALAEFLDKAWTAGKGPTFYELESLYQGKDGWDRMRLVFACRYMKLARLFDDPFWQRLMQNCPAESHSIVEPYDRDKELYLN